jgi:xanthine phosphoribosyltransferase
MEHKPIEEVMERFRTIPFVEQFDMIVSIANGGIVPAAILNQRLQIEMHVLKINLKDEYQQPRYDSPRLLEPISFDYKDKVILLVDDRVKTGATLAFAIGLLGGAKMIKTFAVNGEADYALYNENCFSFFWLL